MPADTMIAPAPGAPAPAPTPSPSPRPSPTPTPARPQSGATDKSEISSADDPAKEMDSIFDRAEARYKPKTDDTSTEEKDKKAEPATAGDKPKAAPATPKAEDKPPASKREGEKQLLAELEKVKKERDESSGKIKEYEAKIADFESRGKSTAAVTTQLEAERKEKEALMGKIRRLTKEHDPAFKEKWQKPLDDEYDYTEELVASLHVGSIVEDPETLTSKWVPTRPANAKDDFLDLYHLFKKNPVAAREQAEQRFGRASDDVVGQIKELHRLSRKHEVAKAEEEAKWKENETKEIADNALWQENLSNASAKARQEIINETLWLYGEDPEDQEGNALLKKGFDDLAYMPKTFNEQVRTLEQNKLNAAVVPKLRYLLDKAKAELAEYKAADEERKNSGPGRTKRDTSDTASGGGEGKTMLEEMMEVTNI